MSKKELYVGTVLEDFNVKRQLLDDNDVKHTVKLIDQNSAEAAIAGSLSNRIGRSTLDMNEMKQYYIYVADQDYDKAAYLIFGENKKN